MSQLKMPKKGESARMLAQLQAEHAAEGTVVEHEVPPSETHVTTLQVTPEATGADTHAATNTLTPEPSPVVTQEVSNAATHAPSRELDGEPTTDEEVAADTTPRRDRASGPPTTAAARPKRASERDERLAHALRRGAEDDITVVTVRVSASLNRYMDDYTARINRIDPKRKYRKQDAVLHAFAAFYADHPMPPAPEEEAL